MHRELRFLLALWKANLQAAMEYRAAFITQVVGMIVNNALYFIFWLVFFDRFDQVRGWNLSDTVMLFAVSASSFGLGVFLFGNAMGLADIVAEGRLDYFLSLPRPVLLHTLASRSVASGLGDFLYGLITFWLAGVPNLAAFGRFLVAVACGVAVFVGFLVLVQSLAFWIGGAAQLSSQALTALITFATYPMAIFDGTAKLLLFTVIPAALMGSVPAAFVRSFSWAELGAIGAGALAFLSLATLAFQHGLRHYESGSAINVQM